MRNALYNLSKYGIALTIKKVNIMSYTIRLNPTEYQRLHGSKYVLKITNDETGESAIGNCTDDTFNDQLKHLKKELSK